MSRPEYRWRQLTQEQRAELLSWRKMQGSPWHSPPHRPDFAHRYFHITAACYEHRPYLGRSFNRLDEFAGNLQAVFDTNASPIYAWCVLPNHYHALVETEDVHALMGELGRLHGRTSHAWNGEENTRGRKVFFRAVERAMRSDRHFWATVNYVHHNAVHHGYVERWTHWPWSSAAEYLERMKTEDAQRIWREYPLDEYGKGWDDPGM